jgi:cobalamin biosynthesis protein CobD/CbiB
VVLAILAILFSITVVSKMYVLILPLARYVLSIILACNVLIHTPSITSIQKHVRNTAHYKTAKNVELIQRYVSSVNKAMLYTHGMANA